MMFACLNLDLKSEMCTSPRGLKGGCPALTKTFNSLRILVSQKEFPNEDAVLLLFFITLGELRNVHASCMLIYTNISHYL